MEFGISRGKYFDIIRQNSEKDLKNLIDVRVEELKESGRWIHRIKIENPYENGCLATIEHYEKSNTSKILSQSNEQMAKTNKYILMAMVALVAAEIVSTASIVFSVFCSVP